MWEHPLKIAENAEVAKYPHSGGSVVLTPGEHDQRIRDAFIAGKLAERNYHTHNQAATAELGKTNSVPTDDMALDEYEQWVADELRSPEVTEALNREIVRNGCNCASTTMTGQQLGEVIQVAFFAGLFVKWKQMLRLISAE